MIGLLISLISFKDFNSNVSREWLDSILIKTVIIKKKVNCKTREDPSHRENQENGTVSKEENQEIGNVSEEENQKIGTVSEEKNQEIGTVSGENREISNLLETSNEDNFKYSNRDEGDTGYISKTGTPFLVDLFRAFHPVQRDAFTAWSTKVRARETNYGSRIDYILSTRDLALKCFEDCQIRPDIYGSDHCPVQCDLLSTFKQSPVIPKCCSVFMPELSGKQQNIKTFFKKATTASSQSLKRQADENDTSCKRQKLDCDNLKRSNSLLSYFGGGKPKSNESKGKSVVKNDNKRKNLDDEFDNLTKTNKEKKKNKNTKNPVANQWKNILKGPAPPPLCAGHKEPCVMHTVKKEGPNFGRHFYCCARPSGHATNKEARCKFFKWKS